MQPSTPEHQVHRKSSNNNNSFKVSNYIKTEPNSIKSKPSTGWGHYRPSLNSKHNLKNYLTSYSTAVLPRCNTTEQQNNCQSSGSNMSKNNYQQFHIRHQSEPSVQNISINVKQLDRHIQNMLVNKKKLQKSDNITNNLNINHNKSATNITANSFLRQTASPNISFFTPKHKQTDFIQKIQLYSRQAKSPMGTKLNFVQKQGQIKKQSTRGQGFSPRFLQSKIQSPKKQKNQQSEAKAMLRQTLDPKLQRNFPQQLKNQKTSPLYFKKKKNQTQVQAQKRQKPQKSPFFANQTSHGNFWRNKAVSPPSKPLSPNKLQVEINPNFKIPPLHIQSNEKTPNHKPSFFMNKKSLNRFNIIKQLGSGTYSDVFLCMDKKTNTLFCLKRYLKSTLRNLPEALDTFVKKIAFQHLAQHSNIVQLYDIFPDGQFVCTIEEYMESGRLHDTIIRQMEERQQRRRQTQNLSHLPKDNEQIHFHQSKIIDKIFDISSALCYLHQTTPNVITDQKRPFPPLVHGDVKAKSILVCMGVCKLPAIQPINMKQHLLNTYSPPQQIIEQVYIPKSDIWSLGLVLFELCGEKRLFRNSDSLENDIQQQVGTKPGYHVFNVNITQQIQKLPNTTQLLKQLMKKMLVIKPQDRPSSDSIINSNVFKMYGFDTDWKQRRNYRSIKIHQAMKKKVGKELEQSQSSEQDINNLISFRKISNESQNGSINQKHTKQFKKKSNNEYEKQQQNPTKQHWTAKLHTHQHQLKG